MYLQKKGAKKIDLNFKIVLNRTDMSTSEIRQKLHNYLEVQDDKKVKALYTIVEEEIEKSKVEYTNDFKKELDRRYA